MVKEFYATFFVKDFILHFPVLVIYNNFVFSISLKPFNVSEKHIVPTLNLIALIKFVDLDTPVYWTNHFSDFLCFASWHAIITQKKVVSKIRS